MGRTVKNRYVPRPRPVERIELSEKNSKRRLILSVLFLAIGATALTYAFMQFLSADSGWTEIQANSSADVNCGDEFVFMYNLGASGISASTEGKAITAVYTDAVIKAYRLFNNVQAFDGMNNVFYINRHPNEEIVVDDGLYEAFSLIQNYGSRELYLGPVYEKYDNLFYTDDESEFVDFDPYLNEEVAAEYSEIAEFARNPLEVNLELLDDSKIRLNVSDEYLAYAEENGISDFIDFYWMKNAFIVDFLADVMDANGYTLGSISSYDGFIRNLDDSGTSYSFNLYDRKGNTVYPAAVMQYTGKNSIVYLRNYMMNSQDFQHYLDIGGGEIRTPYIDVQDGLCKNALNNLVSYSRNASCAEVLLQMIPVYITDEFDEEAVSSMVSGGIYSIYCKNSTIYHNDSSLNLTNLYDEEGIRYTTKLVE